MSDGSGAVRAALLQAKWTGDTASTIEVHEPYARSAAEQGAKLGVYIGQTWPFYRDRRPDAYGPLVQA